jgi:hypothetical protein
VFGKSRRPAASPHCTAAPNVALAVHSNALATPIQRTGGRFALPATGGPERQGNREARVPSPAITVSLPARDPRL